MAFQFPDPNITPEFTGANGITYAWDATDGKWVVKGFPIPVDEECPSYTATAVNYVSGSDPTKQIGITYYAFGNQNGKPFSEVRIHGWGLETDHSAQFVYINDIPYSIYNAFTLGGDPVYEIDAAHGDLNSLYVGTEVTVKLCDPCETVCKDYVDEKYNQLHDEINSLKGVVTTKLIKTYVSAAAGPDEFTTNTVTVGLLSSVIFNSSDDLPALAVGDELMFTGVSLGGRLICDVTEVRNPYSYYISPRSNSNTFKAQETYIVTFAKFP